MLSVVIPNCHQKVAAQTLKQLANSAIVTEVVFYDHAEGDDACAEVASKQIAVVRLPAPRQSKVKSDLLNNLCNAATGEWISILEPGDQFSVQRESLLAPLLARRCDFITGGVLFLDRSGAITDGVVGRPRRLLPRHNKLIMQMDLNTTDGLIQALVFENVIFTASNLVFRKSLFNSLKGFRRFEQVCEWDFALRASLAGEPQFVRDFLVATRKAGPGAMPGIQKLRQETRQMFERVMTEFPDAVGKNFLISLAQNQNLIPNRDAALAKAAPRFSVSGPQVKFALITGMHRSGTSATCQLIEAMGAKFGDTQSLLPANAWNWKGYFEHQDFVAANDGILAAQRCSWHDPISFDPAKTTEATIRYARIELLALTESMQKDQVCVLKDPRGCITYPILSRLLRPSLTVATFRDPDEVANSLDRRDELGRMTAIALWEYYYCTLFRNLDFSDCVVVSYDFLRENTGSVMAELRSAFVEKELADLNPIDANEVISSGPPTEKSERTALAWPEVGEMYRLLQEHNYDDLRRWELSRQSVEILEERHVLLGLSKPGSTASKWSAWV